MDLGDVCMFSENIVHKLTSYSNKNQICSYNKIAIYNSKN